jgi:hypothetical protein
LNAFLWVLQILLAFVFFFHGVLLFSPESPRARQFPYMAAIPSGFARFLAVAEVLAAIATLGLPASCRSLCLHCRLLGDPPGRIVFHIRRREYPNIVFNAILLGMAGVRGLWSVCPDALLRTSPAGGRCQALGVCPALGNR